MERLEKFRANGYDYELLKRDGHVGLFKQTKNGAPVGYEVHIIRHQRAGSAKLGGKIVKFAEKEVPAGNEDFGFIAWSYTSFAGAVECFDGVAQHQKGKSQPTTN